MFLYLCSFAVIKIYATNACTTLGIFFGCEAETDPQGHTGAGQSSLLRYFKRRHITFSRGSSGTHATALDADAAGAHTERASVVILASCDNGVMLCDW